MDTRERNSSALASATACVVLVSTEATDVDEAGRAMESARGRLLRYRRGEDLMVQHPSGRVAAMVVAAEGSIARWQRLLGWARRRWPRCTVAVIGAGESQERAARESGALYVSRPVCRQQWEALMGLAAAAASRSGQ